MKVQMIKDHSYAKDGINIVKYKKDDTLDNESIELKKHFINRGVAEEVKVKYKRKAKVSHQNKMQKPVENK